MSAALKDVKTLLGLSAEAVVLASIIAAAWRNIDPSDAQVPWVVGLVVVLVIAVVVATVLLVVVLSQSYELEELRDLVPAQPVLTDNEQHLLDYILDERFITWSSDVKNSPGSGAMYFTKRDRAPLDDLCTKLSSPRSIFRNAELEEHRVAMKTALDALRSGLNAQLFLADVEGEPTWVTRYTAKKRAGTDDDQEDMDRAARESFELDEQFLKAADAYDSFVRFAVQDGYSPSPRD